MREPRGPVLIDLYCGAGGSAMGYARAGFRVIGVDIKPQPHYPFPFVLGDALTFPLDGADAIHASPPCQGYSRYVKSSSSKYAGTAGRDTARLIGPTRARLLEWGGPYVIENVTGAEAEMVDPLMVCGVMFGLPIARHRLIEVGGWVPPDPPAHPRCRGVARAYADAKGWEWRDMTVTGKGRHAGTSERWAEILGITWPMRQSDYREALPPAYTEWVGRALMAALPDQAVEDLVG